MDIAKRCRNILIEYKDIVFAYIFGSYVQNNMSDDSDIDIAIYLDKKIYSRFY